MGGERSPRIQIKDLAPLATGVIVAFTSALGALTSVGGIGAEIARNQPKLGLIALLLLVVALSVAVGGLIAERDRAVDDRVASVLVPIAGGLFITGAVVAIIASAQATTAPTQPSLSVSFTSNNAIFALEGEAKTTGIPADQHLKIRVYAISAGSGVLGNPIFLADEGPDSSGSVDAKFSIPLAHNGMPLIQVQAWAGDTVPDCTTDLSRHQVELGCLLVHVPPQDARPHLAVGVEGDPKTRVMSAKVKESGVADGKWVILQATGTSSSSTGVIYQALIRPDGSGTVDDSLLIPVPPEVTKVCVVARATSSATTSTCPGDTNDPDASWALLMFPSL
jgi:hypothetical protein